MNDARKEYESPQLAEIGNVEEVTQQLGSFWWFYPQPTQNQNYYYQPHDGGGCWS